MVDGGEGDGGLLVVDRTMSTDIGIRDLYLRVDDWLEETLAFGESFEAPLEPGEHRIKVTNRLYSLTETFEIAAGETVRFEAGNVPGKGLLTVLMAITGSGAYRVALVRDPGER